MIDSAPVTPCDLGLAGLRVSLAMGYQYMPVEQLRPDVRQNLRGMIDGMRAEAFLFPEPMTSLALVPLTAAMKEPMRSIAAGISWNDAVAVLRLSGVQRLCALGILGIANGSRTLTGPAALLSVPSEMRQSIDDQINTDELSYSALTHVARLRITDPISIMARLYGYNSALIIPSPELSTAVSAVAKITSAKTVAGFRGFVSPPENPGWNMFRRRIERVGSAEAAPHVKLYISPVISDVSRCLNRLIPLLPDTQAYAWKIGRFSYGISRPDKICVYFYDVPSALEAAARFLEVMVDVTAQGVPFTRRLDSHGLISLAVDPPSLKPGVEVFSGNSWRMWVTRKLAAALLLAKRQPEYPLSPEQAALWTIRFLGIDPATWQTNDVEFWRN